MIKSKKKIIIASGGTGGHIYPSISLFNFLKKDNDILVTTDNRGLQYLKNNKDLNYKIINSSTIYGKNLIKNFFRIINIFFSIIFSFALIIKFKPNLVIGMGGYSSFPLCVAAYFMRVPFFIYENNLIVGRANKYLLPFCKKILVSTKSVTGIKKKFEKKIYFCGYLLRENIFNLNTSRFDLNKKQLSILVIGGSQSAKVFSELLPNVFKICSENNVKFKIYQQCHPNESIYLKNQYNKLNFDFEIFNSSENLLSYYSKVDLAITRSGASSLAELANLKIPFIAIPLPSSADNHQYENASYFQEKGYCILLEQRFIGDKLVNILKDLNNNKKKLLMFKEKMQNYSDKNAAAKVKELIDKV